jgi:ubiquitin-conjugating enzyme E2 variant
VTRSRVNDAVDLAAVSVVTAGLAVMAVRIVAAVQSPSDAGTALGLAVAGYLAADLLTGCVHWFCDTFFTEETPLIGPGLIAPFREHHRDPLLMTRHGFLELTGSSFRGLAPLLVLLLWVNDSMSLGLSAFLWALGAGAVTTNLLHRWAHDPAPPAIARSLQRLGLVLTPERHAKHHAPPYEAGYCVTTGWMNPVCERLRLWSRAEAALTALGLPVNRG